MLGFISTELHKPCIPLFFIEDAEQQVGIRAQLSRRFGGIGSRLAGDDLSAGSFTGADALLYVILRWAAMLGSRRRRLSKPTSIASNNGPRCRPFWRPNR